MQKTSEKIIEYIKNKKEATPKELSEYLEISERAVFKQLAKLLESNKLTRIGTPPKVFYRLTKESSENIDISNFDDITFKRLEELFLYITPLGDYYEGAKGFIKWCNDRNLDEDIQAKIYLKIIDENNKLKEQGLINATRKLEDSFEKVYLNYMYYADFYSIPQFGKTKLGQLLLYAKQSQDKSRIRQISETVAPLIENLIKSGNIHAVGFIPPSVKREVQFMQELKSNLNLPLPEIKITKVRTDIIVPQKTLGKLSDRITNARNTLIVEENRVFQNVLLIDDAVGSGATLNETAMKIKEKKLAKKIFGLAITGSYKGFDVISEV